MSESGHSTDSIEGRRVTGCRSRAWSTRALMTVFAAIAVAACSSGRETWTWTEDVALYTVGPEPLMLDADPKTST
jgi:hypothetical protein